MLCILYVNAVATLAGIAGLLVERLLPASTTARRWIWCLVIAVTMTVPPIYRTSHKAPVAAFAGETGGTHSHATNPTLWARASTFDPMINTAWLTASGMLILWGVATLARVSFLVRRSRRQSVSMVSPVIDGIPVVVTESIGPATVGVIQSKVLVPRWVLALPGVQRRYVIRHEEEHRKSHDALLLCVASLTLILTPWNLALWWLLRRLRLAVEMDCDKRVVSALGDPRAYGELLLKVALAANRGPRLQPAFLGAGMLERRLIALVAPVPLRHIQRFLLPALACLMIFVLLSMPHPVLAR
ncbi:MAG: M56 family metallopeptidase [Gemmatimonadaceae bacterium]